VRARAIPPRNVQELASALVEEWGNISQQELTNLIQYMRRRCTAVFKAAGGHTRYRLVLLIEPHFIQGHIILFRLVTCLRNIFSLCLMVLTLLVFIQKVKTTESQRTFFFFKQNLEGLYTFTSLCSQNIIYVPNTLNYFLRMSFQREDYSTPKINVFNK